MGHDMTDDTITTYQISGTEMARKWPNTAARVVLKLHKSGSSVYNAVDVLVGAVGGREALRYLTEEIAKADGVSHSEAKELALVVITDY